MLLAVEHFSGSAVIELIYRVGSFFRTPEKTVFFRGKKRLGRNRFLPEETEETGKNSFWAEITRKVRFIYFKL